MILTLSKEQTLSDYELFHCRSLV